MTYSHRTASFARLATLAALALASLAPLHAEPAKWNGEIEKLLAQDKTHPVPADSVICLGSSSFAKWKTIAADFPGLPVVNRGFGGSELPDSTFFLDRLATPFKPRLVVLYAGENDIAAGASPEEVAKRFTAFADKFHASLPDSKLLFLSLKPSPKRWSLEPKITEANRQIAKLCQAEPVAKFARFLDLHTPLLDEKGQPRPELYLDDTLHLNPKGYAVWIKILTPELK